MDLAIYWCTHPSKSDRAQPLRRHTRKACDILRMDDACDGLMHHWRVDYLVYEIRDLGTSRQAATATTVLRSHNRQLACDITCLKKYDVFWWPPVDTPSSAPASFLQVHLPTCSLSSAGLDMCGDYRAQPSVHQDAPVFLHEHHGDSR